MKAVRGGGGGGAPYPARPPAGPPPRKLAPAPPKRTITRLLVGSKLIGPVAVAKKAKVGVSPALMLSVRFRVGAARHCPVVGSVSQTERSIGSGTAPALIVTSSVSPLPILSVATTKALEPLLPVRSRMPSPLGVRPSAMMLGTAV